jgi:hypothetical protein
MADDAITEILTHAVMRDEADPRPPFLAQALGIVRETCLLTALRARRSLSPFSLADSNMGD